MSMIDNLVHQTYVNRFVNAGDGNMHVSLTPELEKMVKSHVDSGLYNSASEVVR